MPQILLNFLLTLAVELPVHALGMRAGKWWERLCFALLINGLTLPLAHLLVIEAGWNLVLVEALVFLSAGILIWRAWKIPAWHAAAITSLANGLSWGLAYLV